MNPNISVIMPVYNTEKFVGEAIESILSQTFSDFEFIIIDDCSSDNSYKICKKYSEKDSRIRLYRNEQNKGISFTRNELIKLSKTNYIATQDSDDISLENRLELSFSFLFNNKDCGVVGGNNIIIDEDNNILGIRKYSNDIKNIILKKSPVSQPSTMFRKDIFLELNGYDKKLNYGEDYDLWLRMYLAGFKIKNLDLNIIKYRIRKGQTKSYKLKETLKNTINIQRKAIKKGLKPSFSDLVYISLEKLLVFFPNSLILFLFKKLEYKKGK